MAAVIEVRQLYKSYPENGREIEALRGLDLTVQGGEIFGLLGPNGAGKTSLLGVLTTRVRPSAGEVRIAGLDPQQDAVQLKRLIATVPQRSNLDRSLTVRENLTFHAAYFGVPRLVREAKAHELLSWLGLSGRGNSSVDKLSGGQMQRVMIARALMHEPRVLFLDEPTLGLDPASRVALWQRIRELRAGGVTIVLSTHYMDEAEQLCDRIAVLDQGRVLACGTAAELKMMLPSSDVLDLEFPGDGGEALAGRLRGNPLVAGVEAGNEHIRVYLRSGDSLPRLLQLLNGELQCIQQMHVSHTTLENVFFHLTGKGLD